MSNSTHVSVKVDEELPLNAVPGSCDTSSDPVTFSSGRCPASCCSDDKHHRKLAVCSIVCGCSCIGIKSLINSVKAEKETDPKAAQEFSQRAKKFGIISIVVWVSLLALAPLLMGLVSYLLTLQD